MANVTRGLSGYVGREAEGRTFLAMLARGDRLVTILGPPGAGKSRFASHHLAALVDRAVIACAASNAGGRDELAALVHASIATDEAREDPAGALADLDGAVLFLDDLDRALPAASSYVEELLARAPRLTVIVTSQRRTGIAGEACLDLGSLGTDEAVSLFEARSRLLRADFAVTASNRSDVVELVTKLDRLPLAIELAAGRANVLAPREMLARMSQRFDLLRARGGLGRHAHLEGAIEVAHDLLSPLQKSALAQASVFAGSFALDGAEAVVTTPGEALVDVLDDLAARSLVRSFEPATLPGETRFCLWETVRAYAAKDAPADVLAAARQRLAAHQANLAASLALRMSAGEAPMEEIAIEAENFTCVFEAEIDRDPALASRALLALRPLCEAHGPVVVYEARLSRAAAALARDPDDAIRARVLVALGRCRVMLGKLERGREALVLGREAAARAGLPDVEGEATSLLALALYWQGLPDDAARDASEGVFARGVLLLLGGQAPEARDVFRELVLEKRSAGDPSDLGMALALLGNASMECMDAAEARTLFDEAEAVLGRAKNRRFLAILELWRGSLALDEGRLDEGMVLLDRAHANLEGTDDRLFLRSARGYKGIAHHLLGQPAEAIRWFDLALAGANEERHRYPLGHFLVHKAAALARLGDTDAADDAFLRAESYVKDALRPALAVTAGVLRGLVDLARADRATDPAERRRHLANAELKITRGTGLRAGQPDRIRETSLDVRLALRLAEPLLAEKTRAEGGPPPRAALRVGPSAMFFHVGDGPKVDLSRRALLRRLLECLAARAETDPGATVDSFALLDAGWPGEQVSVESGLHRVHVAVATLRKMGLGPVLMTDPTGYRIGAEIERVGPS